jgi:hypothetical protein
MRPACAAKFGLTGEQSSRAGGLGAPGFHLRKILLTTNSSDSVGKPFLITNLLDNSDGEREGSANPRGISMRSLISDLTLAPSQL